VEKPVEAENPAEAETRDAPVEENTEMQAPVEEPTGENPVTSEAKGNPIPQDQYAVAKDTYHGHVKPTSSKSKVKPSGKKPLWN
jgi:hypothetical protein